MLSKNAVKYIQSLQQKKYRDAEGVFVAEGPKVVGDLLEEGTFPCRQVYALPGWHDPHLSPDTELITVEEGMLDRISGLQAPNQVLAVFEMREPQKAEAAGCLSLVLDGIQDPGNAGTIIRCADWFGVRNLVCSFQTADMYNPKVVQSSMASLARVNIVYTDIIQWLSAQGSVTKTAASLKGKTLEPGMKWKEGILIIGNESAGISPAVLELADELVRIPGRGGAESLNAGVAAGILLYALTS